MAKGFAKIANALAIGMGGVGAGYGKGSMEVAMRARKEYQQLLKEQRAGAAAAAATQEERQYKESQSEAERAHDFAKMEKAQEFDLTLEEKKLANKIQLKGMGGGGSAGITRTVKDAEGNIWGLTKTGEKIDLGIKGSVPAAKGGAKLPAQVQIADELAKRRAASEGREVTDEDKLRELEKLTAKSSTKKKEMGVKEFNAMVTDNLDTIDPYKTKRMKDPAGIMKEAQALTRQQIKDFESGSAETPVQQSKKEAKQPVTEEAPATSTQGDKPTPATPPGAGRKDSPYMATTEEQQKWVIEHAPSGSFVSDGTKIFRKP